MPLPANLSSCVLGAGFFSDPQLPVALRSVICYARVSRLHKCSLRKAVLPSKLYESVAQHHRDKKCTLGKRIPEHGSSIPPAASCHPAASSTAAAIQPSHKQSESCSSKTQTQRWSDTGLSALVYCSRKGACLATAPGNGHFLILHICFIHGSLR